MYDPIERTNGFLIRAVVFAIAFVSVAASAEPYKTGDSFVGFSAPDQNGSVMIFKAGGARVILFDTPAGSGEVHQQPDAGWFAKNRVLLIVNVSNLSFVKRQVAQSRMKAKPYRLLVVDNKGVAARFPLQPGKVTVLLVDEKGVITGVRFAAPGNELQALFAGKP